MDFAFTEPRTSCARRRARSSRRRRSRRWAELAELGWTRRRGRRGARRRRAAFVEEAVDPRGDGRALLHAPLLVDVVPRAASSRPTTRRPSPRVTASWTLAVGPLVPDLDTATNVAVPGGDTVWELRRRRARGAPDERRDASPRRRLGRRARPCAVLLGGPAPPSAPLARDPRARGGRRRHARARARGRVREGPRAVRQGRSAPTRRSRTRSRRRYTELELGRSLAYWAAWCVSEDDAQAAVAAAAAKPQAADAAVAACERAIQVHGGIGFTWEHVLHRLYKRALGIRSWEASARAAPRRGRERSFSIGEET